MTFSEWLGVGAIVAAALLAAGAWLLTLRGSGREALLQDIAIRDSLASSAARRELEVSIELRARVMAERATRERIPGLPAIGMCGWLLGAAILTSDPTAEWTAAAYVSLVLGGLVAGVGTVSMRSDEFQKKLRQREAADDAARARANPPPSPR